MAPSLFSPFGFGAFGALDDFLTTGSPMGGGFTHFSSLTSSMGAPGANVKRTSTSTRFVNGKKITTKK